MSTRNGAKSFLFGVIAGGVAGSVAALLLAPKSGKEMRSDIAVQAQKACDTTMKAAGDAREATGRLARQISTQAGQIAGITKQAAGTFVSGVRSMNNADGHAGEEHAKAVNSEQSASALEVLDAGESEVAVSKDL